MCYMIPTQKKINKYKLYIWKYCNVFIIFSHNQSLFIFQVNLLIYFTHSKIQLRCIDDKPYYNFIFLCTDSGSFCNTALQGRGQKGCSIQFYSQLPPTLLLPLGQLLLLHMQHVACCCRIAVGISP